MSNITTDLESFENIDYPKNIYELLLSLKNQPIEINCNNSTSQNKVYSAQEFETGETWIDGSPIFGIVLQFNSNGFIEQIPFNLDGKQLIEIKGIVQYNQEFYSLGSKVNHTLGNLNFTIYDFHVFQKNGLLYSQSTSINPITLTAQNGYYGLASNFTVILYYVKTSNK